MLEILIILTVVSLSGLAVACILLTEHGKKIDCLNDILRDHEQALRAAADKKEPLIGFRDYECWDDESND